MNKVKFEDIIPIKYLIPTKSKRYIFSIEKGLYIKNKWVVIEYDKELDIMSVINKTAHATQDNNLYDEYGNIRNPRLVIKEYCFNKPEKALELLNKRLDYTEKIRIKYNMEYE
jgi:hypothetical protein